MEHVNNKKIASYFLLRSKLDLLVFVLIIAFTASCFFVVHAKIDGFLLTSGDTAVEEQSIWNATHGNGFQQGSLLDESSFREHLNFVRFVYLPIYALFPNLLALYGVIIISYAIAGFVLFIHAKSKIGENFAFVLMILFLLNPIVLVSNVGAMHVVAVAGPFLLFALIFYERKKYYWWLFWLLITASVSEFVAPTIIMLGILAWLQRRSLKWVLPPFFAGSAMLVAAHYYITLGYAQNSRLIDVLTGKNILQNISGKRLRTVENFFRPVLYVVPFFSLYILLIIPTLVIVFFVIDATRISASQHLYVFVPTIIIFALLDVLSRSNVKMQKIIITVAILGAVVSLGFWIDLLDIKPDKNVKQMKQAALLIPESGSVSSFRIIAPFVNHRQYFYLLDNLKYTDYIILNANTKDTTNKTWASYIDSIKQSQDYRTIFNENGVSVYAKNK